MGAFMDALGQIRNGALECELSEELANLVQQVGETSKKGSMVLTVTIEPAGSHRVEVSVATKTALPKSAAASTLFFVTGDGRLTRKDPSQLRLTDLKVAGESETE